MDEHFVDDLLDATCDPTLVKNIMQCSWDSKIRMLMTPEEKEEAKREKMEEATWYNDAFGDVMDSPIKKDKNKQTLFQFQLHNMF